MGAWGGHKNGQVPSRALVSVGNGQLAHPAAAYRWGQLVAACKAGTGVTLGVTEGYRPLGVPADRKVLVASKTSTGGSNQWYQKGREDRGLTPSAATPGTSVHGWALALDIYNYSSVWSWLKANAIKFGYAVDVVDDERWHIEYVGSLTVPASTGNTNQKEADVDGYEYIFKTNAAGAAIAWALLHPTQIEGGYLETTNVKVAEGWNVSTGAIPRKVAPANWANALATARTLFELAKAQRTTSGGVTLPDPTVWGRTAAAAFTAALPEFSASGKFE